MRCDKPTRLLVVAIGTLAILTAQTKIDLSSQARRIDFSNAPGSETDSGRIGFAGNLRARGNVL